MNTNNLNGQIHLELSAIKDIIKIVSDKHTNIIPAKKDKSFIVLSNTDDKLVITLYIRVKQNTNFVDECQSLQNDISDTLFQMTSIKADKINLQIDGFLA